MTTSQAIAIGFAMFGAAALMAVLVLASVALGAFIVYKTKREDGEAFSVKPKEGDAFIAGGEFDDGEELPLGAETTETMHKQAMEKVLAHTGRFLKQSGQPIGDMRG